MLSARIRTPTLLQAQQSAGTLTVFAAFMSAAVSGELGALFCGLFVTALAVATWARGRFAHKNDGVWTVLLFGVFLVLTIQVVTGNLDVVLGAARFALLLCAHRLWNRKTERDEMLLLLLSLLLLCAGTALSAELLFGLSFALYAVAGTWALALTHLRWQIESSRGESASALLHSRRLVTPTLLAGLGGLSLLALAGTAALFFIFPRVTMGRMHRMGARPQAIAGLTDTVELGGHGAIADDPRIALRARLVDEPSGVPEISLHWRARALEVWTGRGWAARGGPLSTALPHPPRRPKTKPGDPARLRFQTTDLELLESFGDGVLIAPEGLPVIVRFPQPLSAQPITPPTSQIDRAGDLLYQPLESGDLHYQITSVYFEATPEERKQALTDRPAMPPDVAFDAEAPANLNPRVRALGEKLAKGKDPHSAAQAVLGFLSTGFSYTRVLDDSSPDPISDFLFRRRAGHCELFSSAMVLLLRAGGIPARNVTGFYGGVLTPNGYYAIRAGDAHSWVEVWEGNLGWRLWDPTPSAERGSRQTGLWASAVLAWDGMEARWRSAVVDFDLLAQARALSEAARILQEAGRRLSGRNGEGPAKVPFARLAILAIVAIATIFAWRYLRGRRRRGSEAVRELRPDQLRAKELWRKARMQLARAGLDLPASVPPREAAMRLGSKVSRIERPLEKLIDRYCNARWGTGALAAHDARDLLADLRRALREARAQARS